MKEEYLLEGKFSSHIGDFDTRREILHHHNDIHADEELLMKIRQFLSD